MTIYEADWVCPVASEPVRNGALIVEGGRIRQVGVSSETHGDETIRFPGCVILPGFVNTHAHLELTVFHGLLDDLSFPDWIAKLVRIKYGSLQEDAIKVSAQLGALEMLRAGVTAVGEVMDVGAGWDAMREFGLQGIAFQEVFGPAVDAAEKSLEGLKGKVAVHRRHETETQRVGVSPHAPYTVSSRLYEGVRDFARSESLKMTAHIAESQEETQFVRDGAGPFAEAHRKRGIDVVSRGCTPIAHLDRLNLLSPDMLLVHAIEAEDHDFIRMRDSGARVVHCPRSNAKLGHGTARVAQMLSLGIPVSLGTDSTASNNSIDSFEEMRMIAAAQHLGARDLFRMATLEGARALGMSEMLGSLEAGKRADFIVVRRDAATEDPLADLLKTATQADVEAVFLAGRNVDLDDSELRADVLKIRDRLRGAS